MKKRKHMMPLLSALTASMLYANFIATVSVHSIYQKYDTDGWSQPVISVLMQGLAYHNSFWEPDDKKQGSEDKFLMANRHIVTVVLSDVFAAQAARAIFDSTLTGQSDSPASNGSQMDSQFTFEVVTQDYFDDALLIGDSRVTGIQLYSGWDNISCKSPA